MQRLAGCLAKQAAKMLVAELPLAGTQMTAAFEGAFHTHMRPTWHAAVCARVNASHFARALYVYVNQVAALLTENMQRHPTPACKAAYASKAAQARIAGLYHDNALLAVKLNT
jgi:hypothetical protein